MGHMGQQRQRRAGTLHDQAYQGIRQGLLFLHRHSLLAGMALSSGGAAVGAVVEGGGWDMVALSCLRHAGAVGGGI